MGGYGVTGPVKIGWDALLKRYTSPWWPQQLRWGNQWEVVDLDDDLDDDDDDDDDDAHQTERNVKNQQHLFPRHSMYMVYIYIYLRLLNFMVNVGEYTVH